MGTSTFPITGDAAADQLLDDEPLALLMGMLLDQQVPMEWAFSAPLRLRERLGGLDAAAIAQLQPDEVEAVFRERPALHRYPGSMAKRAHALCRHLVEHYAGRADQVWAGPADGGELLQRLRDLPGFGDQKARIFLALLAKRRGVRPPGWEEASAPYSDDTPRSVADIDSPGALERVRAFKQAQKAKGKGKGD